MRNRINLRLARLLAILMTLCCLTACGEKQEQAEESVAMEDLPFGATLQLLDTVAIPIEYDSRYFTEEEMTVLSNYFYAIQTEDTALYEEVTLDFYTDYVVQQMFQGLVGVDGLLTKIKFSYTPQPSETSIETETKTNADVTFTKITITECEQSTDSIHNNLDNLYPMLNELSGEENYCTEHISDAKFLNLSLSLASGDATTTLSDQYVFLLCVDGQYVICA